MRTGAWVGLLAAGLCAGHLHAAAAENARLRFVAAVYADGKQAGLSRPEGVACGGRGQVVVADTGNGRLLRFTYQDKNVTWGSAVSLPQLTAPSRVHLDAKGDIYALDAKTRRIVHVGAGGEFRSVVAFDGVPAPATVVPKSFAIDAAGSVYVLDAFSGRVLILNAQGKFARAVPLPADAGFVSDVAVDAAGTVFALDAIKRRLFSAAEDAAAFTPLGEDLTAALATLPSYMMTTKGVILVAEGPGSSIVAFGRDGSFLSRQLTRGWNEGMLNYPSQLCVSDGDDVFIADRDNSRVQVFQLIR